MGRWSRAIRAALSDAHHPRFYPRTRDTPTLKTASFPWALDRLVFHFPLRFFCLSNRFVEKPLLGATRPAFPLGRPLPTAGAADQFPTCGALNEDYRSPRF